MAVQDLDRLARRSQRVMAREQEKLARDQAKADRRGASQPSGGSGGLGSVQPTAPNGIGVSGIAPRDFTDPNAKTSDVADIVADITSKDSQIMQRANAQGLQAANRRGLLNSSIAAGASQAAVLDQAIPMAQQTAAQRHDTSQTRLQGGIASTMQNQQFHENTALTAQEGQIQASLQGSRLDAEASMLGARLTSAESIAVMDNETRERVAGMESGLRERLASLEIDEADRRGAESVFTTLQGIYSDNYRTVMANEDLSAEDRNAHLESIGDMLQSQLNAIESVSNVSFDWGAATVGPAGEPVDDTTTDTTTDTTGATSTEWNNGP